MAHFQQQLLDRETSGTRLRTIPQLPLQEQRNGDIAFEHPEFEPWVRLRFKEGVARRHLDRLIKHPGESEEDYFIRSQAMAATMNAMIRPTVLVEDFLVDDPWYVAKMKADREKRLREEQEIAEEVQKRRKKVVLQLFDF